MRGNMKGSEKRKFTVERKSQKPRFFNNGFLMF